MSRIRSVASALALLAVAACGGGSGGDGGGTPGPVVPAACPAAPFLTTSPVAFADIDTIAPLGNLNPPGHTFPTDHVYFYLRTVAGAPAPVVTTLRAPGDLTITWAIASEHVTAGFTDYSIVLQPCAPITLELAHVRSLETSIFGDVSTLAGWTLESEYSTGGETYRRWRRLYNLPVAAGTVLGTAGGNPGQWALDFFAHDTRVTAAGAANPARWAGSRYLHTVCPLDLYVSGAVHTQLVSLLDRVSGPGDLYPCGQLMQDVAGTAQGCWFLEGTTSTYPEDPHLALVTSNFDPTRAVMSVGTSVTAFGPGAYGFTPLGSGLLNRPFAALSADGQTYGYQFPSPPGIVAVRMPDANTLWVERLPGATTNPATWTFTGGQTVFER